MDGVTDGVTDGVIEGVIADDRGNIELKSHLWITIARHPHPHLPPLLHLIIMIPPPPNP